MSVGRVYRRLAGTRAFAGELLLDIAPQIAQEQLDQRLVVQRSVEREHDLTVILVEGLLDLILEYRTDVPLGGGRRLGIDRIMDRPAIDRLQDLGVKIGGRRLDHLFRRCDARQDVVQPNILDPRPVIVQHEQQARKLRQDRGHERQRYELAFKAAGQETHQICSTVPTNL